MDYYLTFIETCQKRNIIIKITRSRYLEMREEYVNKLNWLKEVQKCVDWLYDNEKKDINAGRIRNWMRKSLEFSKSREMQNIQRYADATNILAPVKVYKTQPLWQPPL